MLKSYVEKFWRWRRWRKVGCSGGKSRSVHTAAFGVRWKVRVGVDQEFRERRERQRWWRVGLGMSGKVLVQWISSSLGTFFSMLCSPFSLSVSEWDPWVQNHQQGHSTAGATCGHYPPETCCGREQAERNVHPLSFHSACAPGQQVLLHQRPPLFTHLATPQNCIITLIIRGFL